MSAQNNKVCRCSCGQVTYEVPHQPLMRVFCHCSICQKFNNAPFADIHVYRSKEVIMPAEGAVTYDTYKPPPNVQRGKCSACGDPALEVLDLPLLPGLAIVPANVRTGIDHEPKAKAHVFYESRVRDVDDQLPKYQSYLSSQLSFVRFLLPALLRRDQS